MEEELTAVEFGLSSAVMLSKQTPYFRHDIYRCTHLTLSAVIYVYIVFLSLFFYRLFFYCVENIILGWIYLFGWYIIDEAVILMSMGMGMDMVAFELHIQQICTGM